MPSDGILSKAQVKMIEQSLDELRHAKPQLAMLEALGEEDADLEMRVRQLDQQFAAALELDRRVRSGEVEF